jgi:hypothetical protein
VSKRILSIVKIAIFILSGLSIALLVIGIVIKDTLRKNIVGLSSELEMNLAQLERTTILFRDAKLRYDSLETQLKLIKRKAINSAVDNEEEVSMTEITDTIVSSIQDEGGLSNNNKDTNYVPVINKYIDRYLEDSLSYSKWNSKIVLWPNSKQKVPNSDSIRIWINCVSNVRVIVKPYIGNPYELSCLPDNDRCALRVKSSEVPFLLEIRDSSLLTIYKTQILKGNYNQVWDCNL